MGASEDYKAALSKAKRAYKPPTSAFDKNCLEIIAQIERFKANNTKKDTELTNILNGLVKISDKNLSKDNFEDEVKVINSLINQMPNQSISSDFLWKASQGLMVIGNVAACILALSFGQSVPNMHSNPMLYSHSSTIEIEKFDLAVLQGEIRRRYNSNFIAATQSPPIPIIPNAQPKQSNSNNDAPPVIMPAKKSFTKPKFPDESAFTNNLIKELNRFGNLTECAVEKERDRNGYCVKSYEGNIELPKFQLAIFEDGKVAASKHFLNSSPTTDDKEQLAKKMVAAFIAVGNVADTNPPGLINIKCSDPELRSMLTNLLDKKFSVLRNETPSANQTPTSNPDPANKCNI